MNFDDQKSKRESAAKRIKEIIKKLRKNSFFSRPGSVLEFLVVCRRKR